MISKKQAQLEMAVKEAERFIEKANKAIRHLKSDSFAVYRSADVAAAKRSSMDLTKQLVFVRRCNE